MALSKPSVGSTGWDVQVDALIDRHNELESFSPSSYATTAALAAHEADTTNVHGITDTAALATSSSVTSAISTHAAAADPHGDRAYTDTQIAGRQPLDADLTTIAAIAPTNDDVIQRKAGAWTNRTMAQVKTDLALTKSDVGLGNVTNNAQVTSVTAADGTITIAGTSAAPTVAVGTIAESKVTNLVSDLAGKLSTSGGTVTGDTTLDGAVVINEAGADKDFRVEGDTEQNLFFVDASTDKVGIGTNTPDEKFEVVGNFQIDDAATPTKAYRFRSNGGALDWEVGGADLVISTWPTPGFASGQVDALALLSGGGTQLCGNISFRSAYYGTEYHQIKTDGTANLGAKNGLANIQICGYKNSAGAPAAGAWNTGDLVLDSAGAWHLCTAGGTPGTWT